MIDLALIALFIPTFFLVSITPGMCMTLAMTLGMSIGVRRTLYMMVGELLGVGIVALSAVLGASTVMLNYPMVFDVLKWLGAAYLFWVGINMWQSKGKLAVSTESTLNNTDAKTLFSYGLVTALANPKGWAFMLSLLPPFINTEKSLAPQLTVLIAIILCSEFICMMLYATGGKTIGKLLTTSENVKRLNQVSGSLMILIAIWLITM